jgi:hypothetical protein
MNRCIDDRDKHQHADVGVRAPTRNTLYPTKLSAIRLQPDSVCGWGKTLKFPNRAGAIFLPIRVDPC